MNLQGGRAGQIAGSAGRAGRRVGQMKAGSCQSPHGFYWETQHLRLRPLLVVTYDGVKLQELRISLTGLWLRASRSAIVDNIFIYPGFFYMPHACPAD